MAITSWPQSLPQYPERSYQETQGHNIIRTPMDQGPAKQRFRSLRPQQLSVQYMLSKAQVATLETFVLETLQGVYRFNFPHPRLSTGTNYVLKEVRVIPQSNGDLFSLQHIGADYYRVNLQLEVLP
jgi:hypothetical protein